MDKCWFTKQLNIEMKKYILGILILSVTTGGCYYDVEEQLYGLGGPCDTTGVTFNATVTTILQNYGCISCHSGVSASGSIRLDGYTNVKTQVINGKLFGSINHSSGYTAMPQGGYKMLICDINKIKAWIDAGSLNN